MKKTIKISLLDENGMIPSNQLPSYIDDVLEGTMNSDGTIFTIGNNKIVIPETGKVYVDNTTNKTYRWSGTKYIIIATDLALGETSSTAYAGDKGKSISDKLGDTDISETGTTVTDSISKLNENKLNKTGDSKSNTATFTTSDTNDSSASNWTSVNTLSSGESHASIFSKISQMFKNVRYLWKLLGNTDISSIGDGTVSGAIDTLYSGKSDKGHTHSYAGSSSAGGAATSANKLNTNAGSATKPVYFSNGVPVAGSYELNKTVPSDAKFTDTDTKNTAGSTDISGKIFLIGATSQAANPQTYSQDTAYVGADGCVYSGGTKTSVEGHTHSYAGSSSVGGAATSANKLNTNAGSATKPVYFSNGVPVAGTYSLNKTVPSDAVFTDTTYTVTISMTSLGYKGTTCTVHEFFTALRTKGYSGNIRVYFNYDNVNAGNVSDGTTTAIMNGTACFISTAISGTWRKDYALVNNSTKTYLFYAAYDGSTTPSTQKIVDLTLNTWRGIQNNLTSTSTTDSLSAYQGKLLNDNKSDKTHTHNYAGSSSAGGVANSSYVSTKNASFNDGATGNFQYYDGHITNTTNNAAWSAPTSEWYQIYHNDLSVSGYWTELAFPVNDIDGLAWRQQRSGQYYGWFRILDNHNFSSYALPLSGGTVDGAITFAASDSYGIRTSKDNYGCIGQSGKAFYQSYINNMYGTLRGAIGVNSLFTREFNFSVSAIAGGSDSPQGLNFTTPTGCTALGIVGKYMSGNYYTYLVFTSEYVSGNYIQTMIHNSASVATGTISLTYIILFCKR